MLLALILPSIVILELVGGGNPMSPCRRGMVPIERGTVSFHASSSGFMSCHDRRQVSLGVNLCTLLTFEFTFLRSKLRASVLIVQDHMAGEAIAVKALVSEGNPSYISVWEFYATLELQGHVNIDRDLDPSSF